MADTSVDETVPDALRALIDLHRQVGERVAALAARHRERLQCRRGCSACCVDDITVFDVEAERIRSRHGELLATEKPRAVGACAFLDSAGGCRIYADRPYVCRTQGLPLRWHEMAPDEGVEEHRDICPENEPGPPLTALAPDDCWLIGPTESDLATIARRFDPSLRRVALRALFAGR